MRQTHSAVTRTRIRDHGLTKQGVLTESVKPKDPFVDFLTLIFVVLLFVPKPVGINIGSLQITLMDILAAILLPYLMSGRRIKWKRPDLLVAIYFLVMFISCAASVDAPRAVESVGRSFLGKGVPYLIGRYIATNERQFWHVFNLLIKLLALVSITIAIESLFRFNIHQQLWGLIVNVGSLYREERYGMPRATGWTTHPIMLGLLYVSVVPIAVYVAQSVDRRTKLFAWLKVIALLIAIFFSLSSGPWIAIIIVLILIVWEKIKMRPLWRWGIFFVGIPVTYTVLEVASGRPLLRILMMKLHMSSPQAWYYRWQLYERVTSQMPGHWILGHGLNIPESFGWQWSIDNHYLVVLLTNGLLGLVIWILLMLSVICYQMKDIWLSVDNNHVRLVRALRFVVIASIVAQLSVALFSTAAIVLWFVMGAGVAVGNQQINHVRGTIQGKTRRVSR